ncbi:MAG: glycosyltransferase [Leptolyngbyaceae cyanobacterium SM2_3_12]|nr:glycosyltransferase [Leptolyngbyaceae cyanobacterium SM2_3_12]
MKALQIFQEISKIHPQTIQITHGRNEIEVRHQLKLNSVLFVQDDWLTLFFWKSVIFRFLIDVWFSRQAVALAQNYARESQIDPAQIIIHQTEPNSPVLPRTIAPNSWNVLGPINGNIYPPPIFKSQEGIKVKLRRLLHMPIQRLNKLFFKGLSKADMLFVAGDDRTKTSLEVAGVKSEKMVDCVDCGIEDEVLDRPRIHHEGENLKFIYFGRLVFFKGTFLSIESLAKTKHPIQLDIVGQGPELERCQALARKLGVEDQVSFKGWYSNRSELIDSLHHYRGFVFPSFEDSNGIAVQESMAVGLPVICLNWGGPQLLVDHGVTGYLIDPIAPDYITDQIAQYLDQLATDGALAEKMSMAARQRAELWRWSRVISEWTGYYSQLLSQENPAR